jgi:hypothetical protein
MSVLFTNVFLTASMIATLLIAGSATAKEKACADQPMHLERDGKMLTMIHVTTGPDGLSHGKLEQ